jgi:thiamine-phosphate pyrophosphorylase
LGGIHITSLQREATDLRLPSVPREQFSSSFHKWSEIKHSQFDFGYVFISPVFDSISKTSYKAGVEFPGLEKLKRKMADMNRPVPEIFGLGGIDIPHIKILKEHKFDGAAVYGAVWKSSDPVRYIRHMLQSL